jgi:hypothetical protein
VRESNIEPKIEQDPVPRGVKREKTERTECGVATANADEKEEPATGT